MKIKNHITAVLNEENNELFYFFKSDLETLSKADKINFLKLIVADVTKLVNEMEVNENDKG